MADVPRLNLLNINVFDIIYKSLKYGRKFSLSMKNKHHRSAYEHLKSGKFMLAKVYDVVEGKLKEALIYKANGKIMPEETSVSDIIDHFYHLNKGGGYKKLTKLIAFHYVGISKARVLEHINNKQIHSGKKTRVSQWTEPCAINAPFVQHRHQAYIVQI